ncbi:MAG: tetraacyldisaccharide 4'-kinase [Marinosulfonomonas sp.]|nr:tetraacyldisaccharide 4'-kinase [Marinosulfonomonas sp.]
MRAPEFWGMPPDNPGWRAHILAPISYAVAAATRNRVGRAATYKPRVPVVCVGNINVGGTGKTPTVIALAQRLVETGQTPHIVSRGHGGTIAGPVQVNERLHAAADVGDEPLLLAAFAPTWVSRDRAAGVRKAEQNGAGIILLDDGFQNPSVAKDYSIIVVNAGYGFGNARVMPAGPLRETLSNGLARADVLLSIGPEHAQQKFLDIWHNKIDCRHITGDLVPLATGMDWKGLKVLAFAGIGHPEKFFQTLKTLGANIVQANPLDDHQPLTSGLLKRLESEAQRLGAQLVTTEKDATRLPTEYRQKVLTLPVRLQLNDWSALDADLDQLTAQKPD